MCSVNMRRKMSISGTSLVTVDKNSPSSAGNTFPCLVRDLRSHIPVATKPARPNYSLRSGAWVRQRKIQHDAPETRGSQINLFLLMSISFTMLPVPNTAPVGCVSCSVVSDSLHPWTVTRQAPLSMEFSRQEYWSGLPFPSLPSPEGLPNPGIEPWPLGWQADSLPFELQGSPVASTESSKSSRKGLMEACWTSGGWNTPPAWPMPPPLPVLSRFLPLHVRSLWKRVTLRSRASPA